MGIERKFNFQKFRAVFGRLLKARNYRSVRSFAIEQGFPYNPLSRAINGSAHPTPASLNKWCDALNCTPQERKEIFHAAGYLLPDELDEESVAA